jgi:hypothetical protein
MVFPSPRLAITKQDISGQVKPTLALRCGYENIGAISGKIEALMISIRTSLGGTSKFSGVLVRDLLDIVTETGQPQQRLRDFSTISLGKGERKWEDVLFVPIDEAFDLKQTCKMVLKIHYIVDVKKDNWSHSTVSYTFDFNEAALREWQTRGTVRLEADELIKSRNDFLISE